MNQQGATLTLVSVVLVSSILAANPLGPGDYSRTLEYGGRTRSYIVHVPPKYDSRQPTSVILAFHGAFNNAQQMIRFCGLSEKADKEGFIVVYPNGTGRLRRVLFLIFTRSNIPPSLFWKTSPLDNYWQPWQTGRFVTHLAKRTRTLMEKWLPGHPAGGFVGAGITLALRFIAIRWKLALPVFRAAP